MTQRQSPTAFPCFLKIEDITYTIRSCAYYDFINEMANKLYQTMYGYKSQPELDYFTSTHPQENGCFIAALVLDKWYLDHEFNCE